MSIVKVSSSLGHNDVVEELHTVLKALKKLKEEINTTKLFDEIKESDLVCKDLNEYALICAFRRRKFEHQVEEATEHYMSIYKSSKKIFPKK